MTTSQLASYDSFKGLLMSRLAARPDSALTQLAAFVLSSLVATTLCNPMDVARTQLMRSSGKKGALAIVKGLTRQEGLSRVFRGWVLSFVRLGPQTVLTLVLLEQHRKVFSYFKG
jgi:dicarboxylate transporter 10